MNQNIQIFTKQTKYWPNMTPIIDQTSQMWAKCCIGQLLGKLEGHSCNNGNAPDFVEIFLKTVICGFWMNI